MTEGATTALCTYRVKAGKEDEFLGLLKRHWPTLHSLGLMTDEKPQHFRGEDEGGGTFFLEIMAWKSSEAVATAHEHPEVMAIWEPMGALTEDRAGRPGMEFPEATRLTLV